jgi:hypothetical protein
LNLISSQQPTPSPVKSNQRASERRPVTLPGRLTWKDARGATRFASVVTRNVSEVGAYVECLTPVSIPLYRLVQFQLDRDCASTAAAPQVLINGRVLSAIYRISPQTPSKPQGFALRMMVDPRRASVVERARATA